LLHQILSDEARERKGKGKGKAPNGQEGKRENGHQMKHQQIMKHDSMKITISSVLRMMVLQDPTGC
jgi:hypothetical protein